MVLCGHWDPASATPNWSPGLILAAAPHPTQALSRPALTHGLPVTSLPEESIWRIEGETRGSELGGSLAAHLGQLGQTGQLPEQPPSNHPQSKVAPTPRWACRQVLACQLWRQGRPGQRRQGLTPNTHHLAQCQGEFKGQSVC